MSEEPVVEDVGDDDSIEYSFNDYIANSRNLLATFIITINLALLALLFLIFIPLLLGYYRNFEAESLESLEIILTICSLFLMFVLTTPLGYFIYEWVNYRLKRDPYPDHPDDQDYNLDELEF